jgi:lysine-specific demethylase 3
MVMWRALRETSKNKAVEETKSVRAIDCLDWCEVLQTQIVAFFSFIIMHIGVISLSLGLVL